MAGQAQSKQKKEDGLYATPETGRKTNGAKQPTQSRKTIQIRVKPKDESEREFIQGLQQTIDAAPFLTREEEIECAKAMEAGRDAQKKLEDEREKHTPDDGEAAEWNRQIKDGEAAKEKLISANLYLVAKEACLYSVGVLSFGELFGAGYEYLVRGMKHYDYRKGPASHYLEKWADKGILAAFREVNRTGFTKSVAADARKVRDKLEEIQREEQRTPSAEELSEETGFSVEKVRCLLAALQGPASLEYLAESEEKTAESETVTETETQVLHEPKHASGGFLLLLLERYHEQLADPFFCEPGTLEAVEKLCRLEFGLEQPEKKRPALYANEQKKVNLWINQWHRAEMRAYSGSPQKAFGQLLTPRTAAWILEQYGDRLPPGEMRAALKAFSKLELRQLTDDNAPYRLIGEQGVVRDAQAAWDACIRWLCQHCLNEIYEFILTARLSPIPAGGQEGS